MESGGGKMIELKTCPFCGVEKWLKEIAIQLQIRNKIEAKDWDYYNHCLLRTLKELEQEG